MNTTDSLRKKQELLGELKTNNSLAFSKLYDQYAALLLGVITKIVSDKTDAIQLLEIAFTKIRLQLDQFQPTKQQLFVWLLQIARSTALEALNERQQLKVPVFKLIEDGKVISPDWKKNRSTAPVDSKQLSTNSSWKELMDSILFKNCTPEEAAISLGIPVEDVRQQLRLAMQQLRAIPRA